MSDHPYGFLSLTPPLVAIVLAIATRRVVLSLLTGVFAGVVVMAVSHPTAYVGDGPWLLLPAAAVASTFRDHLWATLIQEEKLAVFAFTLLMGAMVGVVQRSGGMRGLVDAVARWASSARRAQLAAWMLGLVVFFDDYANTMLLGGTLRPLFDRLKISREKLAYLVDSTAAPVSGLALVSTWVAGEIGYVRDGLAQLPGVDWDPLQLFLQSIPYRFYVLWALLLVPIGALLRRDLPPMDKVEAAARRKPAPADDVAAPADAPDGGSAGPRSSHWLNAVAPILVTVVAIVSLMYRSGLASLAPQPASELTLMQIFGNANAFMSLVWGTLIGLFSAVALVRVQGLLNAEQVQAGAAAGALHMAPALAILWLASALSALTGNDAPEQPLPPVAASETEAAANGESHPFPYRRQRLYTGDYLGSLLQNRMPIWLAPTAVFALAGAIAFATGTSWGTMGIVMPLAINAAYRLLAASQTPSPDDPILLGCIGGVLAGAIFGDHCSPISDTTVMSSQACGCSHLEHVRTQLPYALLAGVVSILLGTLPVAFGVSPWILLPLGVAAMIAALFVFGRQVDEG